jgi:hypothetical protein
MRVLDVAGADGRHFTLTRRRETLADGGTSEPVESLTCPDNFVFVGEALTCSGDYPDVERVVIGMNTAHVVPALQVGTYFDGIECTKP